MSTIDLFQSQPRAQHIEPIGPGAAILRAFLQEDDVGVLHAVEAVAAQSPYRHLITPGGCRMSVAMTNCGELGWVSDRRGYRYDAIDPLTGQPWPPMPPVLARVAANAAAVMGYARFAPEACLINRYEPGARLSLHQDQDEEDASAPIVSLSLGVAATFLWGGLKRTDKTQRMRLESGDAVVWGGASRFVFHGVAPVRDEWHPLTGKQRINVTFRKVRPV